MQNIDAGRSLGPVRMQAASLTGLISFIVGLLLIGASFVQTQEHTVDILLVCGTLLMVFSLASGAIGTLNSAIQKALDEIHYP